MMQACPFLRLPTMYLPAHFQASTQEAYELVRNHPLGALVHLHAGGLEANHLPWWLETPADAPARLIGHVARANPLCTQLSPGAEVLVIFQAEQGYISPNWYPSKHRSHRQVPTWNYRVVHLHGTLRLHDDPQWVLAAVGKLTRHHEQQTQAVLPHAAGPWKIKSAPSDYLQAQLAQLVGIEVCIRRVEAKFKLSQNRSVADRASATQAVAQRGDTGLGLAMQTHAPCP